MPIICEGCGQRVPIPEGYRRNKIQCSCGVICPVPESARQEVDAAVPTRSPPVAAEEEGSRIEDRGSRIEPAPSSILDPRSSILDRDPEPERDDGRPTARKRTAGERRYPCRRCGQLVRRQGECPSCDPETAPPVHLRLSLDDPEDEEEEDSSPYALDGPPDVLCPKCKKVLEPGAVLCLSCGFHLKKRKKVAKTFQPIDRTWETNYSYQTRFTLFWICVGVSGVLGLIGVIAAGADAVVFIGSFLLFAAMMAFLLGTFTRIHLTRDTRGRVRLTKTWRVCFYPLQPTQVDVRGNGGICSGRSREVSFWEWLVFFFLLVSGLIPGLVWWYFVIHKVTFHVSLTRDHGYCAVTVYQGWDEMQMKEIAYTLRDATGLPYDAG